MKRPNGYWNIKENVFEEARKYQTKMGFKKEKYAAYKSACKNGWLDEMSWFRKQTAYNKKWYRDNVFEESKKYKTRSGFERNSSGAYDVARKNGWLDEMPWLKNEKIDIIKGKIDCVYQYYFKETNSIYIGRTVNRERRDKQHLFDFNDAVFIHSKENDIAVPPMEIIEDNLTLEEGQYREGYWVEYYKERGYIILNRTKTGSLGKLGRNKWNKETVFEEAKKYKIRSEFQKACVGAYDVARKNNWLDELFPMKGIDKGKWTKENVFKEAKKYCTKGEFKKGCSGAYQKARENGWLDEMTWFENGFILMWKKRKYAA